MKQLSVVLISTVIACSSFAQHLIPGQPPRGGGGGVGVVVNPGNGSVSIGAGVIVNPGVIINPAVVVKPNSGGRVGGGNHDVNNPYAHAEAVRRMAEDLLAQIEMRAHQLNTRQLTQMSELLRQIDQVMTNGSSPTNPTYPPTYPPTNPNYPPMFPVPYGPFTCDSNNNVLLDGNYRQVYDFSNRSDCMEAIQQIQKGQPYCDSNNNTLLKPLGELIYDFSSISNCKLGISRVSMGKPFCDYNNNTLLRPDGQLIYDFSSESDCTEAMNRY